jgi:hypothetical protein
MSNHHVVNLVLIVSAGLVMHAPTGIHEFQTALLDKLTYLGFHGGGLKAPPHAEEFHLYVGEVFCWVIQQRLYHRVQNKVNSCFGNLAFSTSEVLINGLEPPHVVMSMCNHVYSDRSALRVLLSEPGDVLPQAFLGGLAQLAELVRTMR